MENLNYKAIGRRIRQMRREKHITQEKLGELCGLSTAHIGHIERGTRIPSLQTAAHIVAALDSSMDYLLFDTLNEPKTVLAAIDARLQGKDTTRVRTFFSMVMALADKIDEL